MKVSVPATSANLGPGFDCLGLAISMKNQVIIRPSKFHSVSLKGEGANNPALKDNNMFISIFNDFYHNLSYKKRHFRFEFNQNSPIKALGKKYFIKDGKNIKVDFLEKDCIIHDFKLPISIEKCNFNEETLPIYNLPAV